MFDCFYEAKPLLETHSRHLIAANRSKLCLPGQLISFDVLNVCTTPSRFIRHYTLTGLSGLQS